jgi:PAS domain S-box-containing protein
VEGHLLPTAEPDGAVLWQGYVADITERKRADEALRDRERLLSFVTGSARVGLVVVDADYRYRFANEAYAEIFDLKSLDLVGARVSEVLAAGWSQIQPKLDLALAGEQVAYELALPPVPGKREARYFTVVYEPRIGAGGAPTVVVVAVDISERKRFEMALLESERRFRLAQQAARIGSFDSNVQTDVNIWTNELEALYGLEPGEFPRTQSAWERLLHPEDRAEAVRCIERALETGLPTEGEWRVIWPDGSQHWIAGRFQMFKDEAGKPHRLTGVNLDVTDRKQAAASLERANADLERGMHQLGQINRELRVKTQENEAFVYSVSHDLRSPLVNLQGFSKELDRSAKDLRALVAASDFTQASRERALTTLDGAVAKSLRFIQTAVGRLSSIIDALLRLSRAGRVVFQRQRVDVQSIVARVVDSLKITREERKATIEVGELPDALGDAAAIEQVFANLIGNALNYLDEQRPGRIEIGNIETSSGGRPNESTTYFVRDNGLGIQEAGRAKVFQPFQRLHPQAAAGEGMGLAIVQRVVERQGGSIWFESIFGQGTTFFVTLPAYPAGTSVDLASEIRSDTGKGARS